MNGCNHGDNPIQFVLTEGRLLNEARYSEWISLFADDGYYWVPLEGEAQVDPENSVSLAYEDRILLAARVKRILGPRAHSLTPGVRSVHVLQSPQVDSTSADGSEISLYTPFVYTETRGEKVTLLTGAWRHKLRRTQGNLRIVLKRVDLINAGTAIEAIQLFP